MWFKSLPAGRSALDLRVQRYRGKPVLHLDRERREFSTGPNTAYIADQHYNVMRASKPSNGLTLDSHEFHLTREGTALVTIYRTVPYDLSSFGGSASGKVIEGMVQAIDIRSGQVRFEWHSLDHVGLDESYAPVPTAPDEMITD